MPYSASLFLRFSSSLLALGVLAVLRCSPAAAQDSTLIRLLRRNQYPLQAGSSGFGGVGWEKLQRAWQKSQFVLIGEDHGTAQIPQFAAAVAREFQPALYAAEVDPYVAQAATRLAAAPGAATAYLQQYPEALCFFDWAEELELVRALQARQVPLLGLDQVYVTTSAPFYAQLAGLVRRKAAKAYLQRQAAAFQARNLAFERTGSDDFAMMQQPQAAIDSLLLLTKSESPAARQMAQAYAASYAIYKQQAHQQRINLMKQNLLQAVRPYQAAPGSAVPKMLFKFGANHLARGLSQSVRGEFYDLGNLVQNLADLQGQQSLHLYVVGKQGERAESDNPYFPGRHVARYPATEHAALQPFLAQVAGPDWAVFDLRLLRRALTTGQLQVASPALQRTILGYDYLVVIPETTASRLL